MNRRVVVGVTGASGAIYAERVITALKAANVDVDLVFTKTGRVVWQHEIGRDPRELGCPIWAANDFTAPIASGSVRIDGMIVVPCSSGSAARIAHGLSIDLVGRAADVVLKERRPLVLVLRESPLSLVHLRNLTQLAEAGAVVLPASPGFYHRPQSIEELVDHVVCRALDRLGIDNELSRRWAGLGDPHDE